MKVLTFSTSFPNGHPQAGSPTYFVEKVMACLAETLPDWQMKPDFMQYDWHEYYNCTMLKAHTIRVGNRWKAGDMASLRIWSDKPYRSKQVEFAQVVVKKVWEINIHMVANELLWQMPGCGSGDFDNLSESLKVVAKNDGLDIDDLISWFAIHPKKKEAKFSGQIICWSDKVNYR